MESGLNYAEIQQTLTNDLTNLDMYLQRWRLRLNVEKNSDSCFHLTNCMAKHQMEVSRGGNTISTTPNPKYLGVTLDMSLTQHLPLPSRVLLTSVVSKCPGTSTGCNSEQPYSTGVRVHPIDTNLHATSCQRDNAS